MLGAIAGDVIGSVYERNNVKFQDFPLFSGHCRFTDDSVLTAAVAEVLLEGDAESHEAYVDKFHEFFHLYPDAGFGGTFFDWARSRSRLPYGSWGNGSAMRVSPIGYAFDTLDEVLAEAKISAEVTHDHSEGIKGAQAIAAAVFLARHGESKASIKTEISQRFSYDLRPTLDEIRPSYRFYVSCQGSVPQAITAFLESENFEDAVRKAISLGGDSDTLACMAGAIAEAFYGGVPDPIAERTIKHLDTRLRATVEEFATVYGNDVL
ncbi:hypothetical protein CCAX7_51450 [Capsulimonas corticalis]|uniref:Uncharacterized protein n=1 Tax=Capsulimonas corticalis TaxID=2219043 RepID=A0A402CP79_9BACT|nr:ADP-ribosylglycohydrolase family protein [Capsulimonas corticalis]BDI33094.1 hypothetical protein CCAX7_51450 [Capsulimonas corticalis]